MIDIKPDEISAILRQQLSNFNTSAELEEVGTVLQVGDGIARIYGLNNVKSGELVEFENGKELWFNVYTTKSNKWHSIDRAFLEVLTVGDMREGYPDMCDMNIWEFVGAKNWADNAFTKN